MDRTVNNVTQAYGVLNEQLPDKGAVQQTQKDRIKIDYDLQLVYFKIKRLNCRSRWFDMTTNGFE